MRSLEQLRAANAFAALDGAGEEVLNHAVELPLMLQKNGLLAAWAYLLAKDPGLLESVLDHLRQTALELPDGEAAVVLRHWLGAQTRGSAGLGGGELRDLTAEVIALAVWLKRAAKARVPEEGAEGGGA